MLFIIVFWRCLKHFGLSLEEIATLIEIRSEGIPPCANLKAMVKKHLDNLEQRIKEMLTFHQELSHRYEKIETALSDSSNIAIEELCQDKICGLIERDDKNETENYTHH
ncbi:MerR family DNA-binding protein [Pleurocapsales cyanobacterium LEGE 06147]|nr:MerR family DNA-binding protein [Pleurocapsales cyanobacterium LEGE 06147]